MLTSGQLDFSRNDIKLFIYNNLGAKQEAIVHYWKFGKLGAVRVV